MHSHEEKVEFYSSYKGLLFHSSHHHFTRILCIVFDENLPKIKKLKDFFSAIDAGAWWELVCSKRIWKQQEGATLFGVADVIVGPGDHATGAIFGDDYLNKKKHDLFGLTS